MWEKNTEKKAIKLNVRALKQKSLMLLYRGRAQMHNSMLLYYV